MKDVTLVLQDGTTFQGKSFGYKAPVTGEVVFNTAMMGYPESLTDPSYAGQMLVMTYPLVGNYGVPPFTFGTEGIPRFMESDRIYAQALIVNDYSEQYSHWNAVESLGDWLKREKVPGVTGIDTRQLTKVLREHGVMMGKLEFSEELRVKSEEFATAASLDSDTCMVSEDSSLFTLHSSLQEDYGSINWVERVSCKDVIRYNEGAGRRVVLVDCGVKANIIRCLVQLGV